MARLIDADALIKDIDGDLLDGIAEARAIEKIENAPTIGGWISVKDRLPEEYERILTYDKYSDVKENRLLRSYPCVSWSYGFHVTHWMPLPESPKEES